MAFFGAKKVDIEKCGFLGVRLDKEKMCTFKN
jgi:hypothetical protein